MNPQPAKANCRDLSYYFIYVFYQIVCKQLHQRNTMAQRMYKSSAGICLHAIYGAIDVENWFFFCGSLFDETVVDAYTSGAGGCASGMAAVAWYRVDTSGSRKDETVYKSFVHFSALPGTSTRYPVPVGFFR
jgi:hypothetical protein